MKLEMKILSYNKSKNIILFAAILVLGLIFWAFKSDENHVPTSAQDAEVTCTDSNCFGSYIGPEFIEGDDIAHQFSNTMSREVGDQLKKLYRAQKYCKVDFQNVQMSTKGMGTGTVTYKLNIPFVKVEEPCNAKTSFDHVGGWNHPPALEQRKKQLQKALLKGDSLDISPLFVTKEGLQEYWIQWRNKEVQKACQL